jgi:hypothetical protein
MWSSWEVEGLCSWADYLIIATSSSNAQMKGLLDELGKLAEEKGWDVPAIKKKELDPILALTGLGGVRDSYFLSRREGIFFALEKLWYQG